EGLSCGRRHPADPAVDFCRNLSYFVVVMKKILFPVVCALIAAVLLLSAPVSSPPAAAESMTVHFGDGAAVWTECEGATSYVVSVADADGGEVLRATVSS